METAHDFQGWLNLLVNPNVRFQASFASVAGRLRLAQGWQTRQHSLPDHLFYFVVEGNFESEINDEVRHIGPNEFLWCARGTQIRFWLPTDSKLVIQRFRLQVFDADGEILDFANPFLHLTSARSCAIWMEQIVDEASYAGLHGELRLRGLLTCLFTEIARLEAASGQGAGWLTRAQRETVTRYFAENARRWPSPLELARSVELSPDYFTRCFRRTFGVAPRRWLVEERQRLAALRLLETNQNISQIASELGYDDVFLFSRQFKAVFGVSPTLYRQNHGAIVAHKVG